MDAVRRPSKPHGLLPADGTRDGAQPNCAAPPASSSNTTTTAATTSASLRASSEAGFSSGRGAATSSVPATATATATASAAASSRPAGQQPRSPAPRAVPSLQKRPPPSSSSFMSSPPLPSPSSLRSPSSAGRPSSRPGRDDPLPPSAPATRAASAAAAPLTSLSHFFFGTGNNTTTPETSLVPAHGKSIPLGDATAEHRTSALRELNSSFPSPVFRHRQTKSTGAQNSTYSQPVIVRTYSGPSHSPSTSAHYRASSHGGSRRAGSRAASSRRIPLASSGHAPPPPPPPPFSALRDLSAADSSSNNARGARWGLTSSLFGMARSKGKKGSLIPWPWSAGSDDPLQNDEAKLPPLEAFSFKGFMADLQTTTDIHRDLDRIAEICARSRYSLSNQYDSHVTPHGSGAAFSPTGGGAQQPPPGQSRGTRRRGSNSPGGPTLQAVPSDDDEAAGHAKGHRRRRGGMGAGRRRSAAYGTLETIMSSSRSSEEDKTKKKSAAELAEAVRGRATRKAPAAAAKGGGSGEQESAQDPAPGSDPDPDPDPDKPPHAQGVQDGKGSNGEPRADGASEVGGGLSSLRPSAKQRGKAAVRRPKSASFAHAVIGSSRQPLQRQRQLQEQERQKERSAPPSKASAPTVPPSAVPALLSEPALPQTTDEIEVYSTLDASTVHTRRHGRPGGGGGRGAAARPRLSARPSRSNPEPAVHIVGSSDEAGAEAEAETDDLFPASSQDAAAAGILSSLTHWIPWPAGPSTGGSHASGPAPHGPSNLQHPATQPAAPRPPSGPSHAEGSLRELLKTANAGKLSKGKAVDGR